MTLNVQGKDTDVEYIRIHRDARNVVFFALVNGEWVHIYKGKDNRLPTYSQVEWPDPEHMYGDSRPYRLQG